MLIYELSPRLTANDRTWSVGPELKTIEKWCKVFGKKQELAFY